MSGQWLQKALNICLVSHRCVGIVKQTKVLRKTVNLKLFDFQTLPIFYPQIKIQNENLPGQGDLHTAHTRHKRRSLTHCHSKGGVKQIGLGKPGKNFIV